MDFSSFSLPTRPSFDDSHCSVSTSIDTIHAGDGMTVLVGAVSETGQVALVSDSMQWSKSGKPSAGLWKTLRINDRCAIGFSGNGTQAGRIAAILMRKPEWANEAGKVDLLKRIEEANITKDWSCFGACAILRGILFKLAEAMKEKDDEPLTVNVVFVGKESGKAYMGEWFPDKKAKYTWNRAYIEGTSFTEAHLMAFGPGKIKGPECPKAMIKNTAVPFADRVLAICELYAERFPEEVNRDFWIREDCFSFVRNPLGTR